MMKKSEVTEAAEIVVRTTDRLLATSTEQKGRAGSDLRRACGDMKSNAEVYIVENEIGPKLANCFLQARLSGATLPEFEEIREAADAEPAVSLLAVTMKQSCVEFALQQ